MKEPAPGKKHRKYCFVCSLWREIGFVVAHLRFHGHFTGRLGQIQGQGQTINFIATDIYRVTDGRVAENWHIEDNLTLQQQLGLIPK